MSMDNENKVPLQSELNKLNISDKKNCSYCKKPFTEDVWCNDCDPFRKIEGWTSGNQDIDKFIKDTIYDPIYDFASLMYLFLEWIPFERFEDITEIGVGGFAKVYSATWIDGNTVIEKLDDGSWKKLDSKPTKVALKKLNGSQNMSAIYLNELKTHWEIYSKNPNLLGFYGLTKDPKTGELIMVIQFFEKGTLRSVLSNNFNNIFWEEKIRMLLVIVADLRTLHTVGYFHKDFHSGNILHSDDQTQIYIADFGLSGPASEQKSSNEVCGVLPYVAPEVLNKRPYTSSSDIYSFGAIMTEVSSGKPPFHKRKHDAILALEISRGLRPDFGKGTPEIYKKLTHRCMDPIPDQRPTADEVAEILYFWLNSIMGLKKEEEKFGYKGSEVKAMFEEADKEIPNISITDEKDPNAIYTSRVLSFDNLPVNSESHEEEYQDSRMLNLELSELPDD